MQKKRSQSRSRPENELFGCHQEFTSDSLQGLTGNSVAVKAVSKEIFNCLHQRGVYSGPLTRVGLPNGERKLNDPSFSRLPYITTASSLVPSRTSTVEDSRPKFGLAQNRRALDAAERFSGPIKDMTGVGNENWRQYSGRMMGSRQLEETRARRPALVSLKTCIALV